MTAEPDAVPALSWPLWLVLVPGALALALRANLPHRPDYLGHYLAGYGASLLAIWFLCRAGGGRPELAAVGVCACVGLGWLVEATLFPLGGFDHVDFHSQSLGAAIAGLGLARLRAGDPATDWPDGDAPLTRNGNGRLVVVVGILGLIVGVVFAFA